MEAQLVKRNMNLINENNVNVDVKKRSIRNCTDFSNLETEKPKKEFDVILAAKPKVSQNFGKESEKTIKKVFRAYFSSIFVSTLYSQKFLYKICHIIDSIDSCQKR